MTGDFRVTSDRFLGSQVTMDPSLRALRTRFLRSTRSAKLERRFPEEAVIWQEPHPLRKKPCGRFVDGSRNTLLLWQTFFLENDGT